MLGFLERKQSSASRDVQPAFQAVMNTPDEMFSEGEIDSPAAPTSATHTKKQLAKHAIRLVPIIDHNAAMPVKYVKTVERGLDEDGIIRLGRIESAHPQFKDLEPIVFRSKVVSRIHAEIFLEKGCWYIRDVQSSSGTFINSTRLSPPNQTSGDRPLADNDTLQLGLNFRGGQQESFQCVKMRVLLDYSWKRNVTQFNVDRHDELRKSLLAGAPALEKFEDCSICLFQLEPSQPLFISPCSHGWHYKCIRPLLIRGYPNFHCPNCRGTYDLEDDDEE